MVADSKWLWRAGRQILDVLSSVSVCRHFWENQRRFSNLKIEMHGL
jgi:hypothetical protein